MIRRLVLMALAAASCARPHYDRGVHVVPGPTCAPATVFLYTERVFGPHDRVDYRTWCRDTTQGPQP